MPRALSALIFLSALVHAADQKDALAPTGTLRVTFLGGNPVQGRVDAATGAVTGPVADLTQELAKRLSVPFKVFPSAGVREVLDAVKMHSADIGFLAFDATRAAEVDFSQPYSLAYNSYIVSADSPIRTGAEIDHAGVRVAAPRGDSGDLYLSRTLKQAELKSIAGLNPDGAFKMLGAHEIDAYATNRARLTEMAARFPGLRVLPENFFAVEQSMVVAKGNTAGVEYLNRFIDGVRDSGFLKSVLVRANLSGVEIAPPK
ncbi:MAG: transporter substrate-binding domain-containing protein [Bryobacterales bacterium]|nr:transporter substrate-binding domain-containing protein [Bryobacterales bacterium]MBV9396692.1 transporter substrate-binding domain-containing protein [Bryobacterales bacterium]